MSDQGWLAFLAAQDLTDWVVLHGGPTAVFKTKSIADAADLAKKFSELSALEESAAHISIVSKSLSIRLTREVWKIEDKHIELARAISKIAHSHGAVANPSQAQEVQFAIAAKADAINLPFWRAVLGYDEMLDDNAIDPIGNSSTVWMQELDDEKALQHAMHLDVSLAKEQAEKRVAAALLAGGRLVDDSHAPSYWILSDSAGNKVCVVSWPDGSLDPNDSYSAD